MRRCPKCNREFAEEWLTFCTDDGTPLIESEAARGEPPPTLFNPPMPPSVSPTEQPTLDMPGRGGQSPIAEYIPPPPIQPGWTPPPPPTSYSAKPQQSLAAASFVLGLVSITVGWCCSFGILTAPVALVLGIVSLVQIKNEPARHGGKGLAIAGIICGALYFVILIFIAVIYGIGIMFQGIH